jgi:hypothetical protein
MNCLSRPLEWVKVAPFARRTPGKHNRNAAPPITARTGPPTAASSGHTPPTARTGTRTGVRAGPRRAAR